MASMVAAEAPALPRRGGRATSWLAGDNAPLILLAVVKLALHLATNGLYGYHRDELYYLASGKHLAFGFVDFPPVTPLLARLDVLVLGQSPWALRLLPALAGAAIVVLAGLVARELGGGRSAQILASIAALACPLLLATNWLFQTVSFDQLAWMVALLLATRAIRRDDPRLWLGVGLVAGIGLETKFTIAVLGIGLAAALVYMPGRRHLRTPWPWLGAALAFAIFAPNLVWQAMHGWPTLDYTRNHSRVIQQDGGAVAFLANQLVIVGLLALPVWLTGWYHLLRERDLRPLGVAAALAFLLFLPDGKFYYPGPLIPFVLAAGCVRIEAIARRRRRWRHAVPAAGFSMILGAALMAPLLVPLVPDSSMARFNLDKIRKDFADTVGWRDLAVQVEAVYLQLPAGERTNAAVLASNYGEAGALVRYGRGLPPVISPQLTFWYWKPAGLAPRTLIVLGYDAHYLRGFFGQVTPVASITNAYGVRNDERGVPIFICRKPLQTFDATWNALRQFQ
ncbi:MAG TPA: glycosyltransferase family 39 protein [Dehalococcoidia bacterium]|nr:glycosyltransferase family 39 protein [Dehalococcoidia bacterium]